MQMIKQWYLAAKKDYSTDIIESTVTQVYGMKKTKVMHISLKELTS